MTFDGRTIESDVMPGIGPATVSATSLAAGSLLGVAVNFPSTLPSVPRAVVAYVAGFVSGSAGTVIKGTTAITTTGFSVTLLNTGAGAATFTNMPITYLYWL